MARNQRIPTRDGHQIGVGDLVWTENHIPWILIGFSDLLGEPWVDLVASHSEPDLDGDLGLALQDAPRLLYRDHPRQGCYRAGCRFRPWGEAS